MTQTDIIAEIDELMKKRAEHQHALDIIDGAVQAFRYMLVKATPAASAEPEAAS